MLFFLSFAVIIMLRILRIMIASRPEESQLVGDLANSFWTRPPLGHVYSAMWVIHLALTALFYIRGISALRRLSNSIYHAHPEALRRPARMRAHSCAAVASDIELHTNGPPRY